MRSWLGVKAVDPGIDDGGKDDEEGKGQLEALPEAPLTEHVLKRGTVIRTTGTAMGKAMR